MPFSTWLVWGSDQASLPALSGRILHAHCWPIPYPIPWLEYDLWHMLVQNCAKQNRYKLLWVHFSLVMFSLHWFVDDIWNANVPNCTYRLSFFDLNVVITINCTMWVGFFDALGGCEWGTSICIESDHPKLFLSICTCSKMWCSYFGIAITYYIIISIYGVISIAIIIMIYR